MKRLRALFIDLPIVRKLLLASVIIALALLLLSVETYRSVQTFSQDEEQLASLYVTQKTVAQYMRLVVDIETGFRGYVLTEQVRYLRPYRVAQEGIFFIGRDLERRVSGEQLSQIQDIQALVKQLLAEKDELIRAVKVGQKQKALDYIEEGHGRMLMTAIRDRISHFDQLEQQRVAVKLNQLSQDRISARITILGGGVITFGLMVCALYLISRSIAVPLVSLSKTVGASRGGMVPRINVLERQDEIGDLTRVMHEMSVQIDGHLSDLERSETALRVVNEDLSASESKYRGLVDNAPIGIFTTKGVDVTFSNRYNQVLAGLDPDDVADPAAFRQWIHPEDRTRVLSEFAQAVADSQPYETVFRFLHEDGTVRKVLSRRIPIVHGTAHPAMYIGFNIDITALEDLQSRLSRAERLATLGQVAAGIAHEIRNPLVGIGSNASLLLDECDASDPRHAELELIANETRRLDRIVNHIIDYARPRELAPVSFHVSELLDDVVKLLDSPLAAKRLTVRSSSAPALPQLHADRDQLKQVLLNVFHNAIEASPAGTDLDAIAFQLSSSREAGVVIQVTDYGAGIPGKVLARVFEPFFTSGKRQGTGLGLAICRNIIESHGGDIQLTSEIGKGTSVRIWLPLRQAFQFAER